MEVLRYLDRVDGSAASRWHRRLDPFLPFIRFDYGRPAKGHNYFELQSADRDSITGAIADVIALLERRQTQYAAASSPSDYDWAYRAGIAARQVDSYLRQLPTASRPFAEELVEYNEADDLRDRFQADNAQWIIQREAPSAKIILFAHSDHLSKSPIAQRWKILKPSGRNSPDERVLLRHGAGTYLESRYKQQLIAIGNFVGHGTIGCAGYSELIAPSPPDTLAGTLGSVDTQTTYSIYGMFLARPRSGSTVQDP